MACALCGDEPAQEVEVLHQGTPLMKLELCEPCLARSREHQAEQRREFEALLAGGLTREQANAVMIARGEGQKVS